MAESSFVLKFKKEYPKDTEAGLVQTARKDKLAFGELYKLYVERVFRYLFSRIGNVQDAEDATAQTFLAALESIGKFRQDGHFASWLFGIARNKSMDYFRKQNNTIFIEEAYEISTEDNPLARVIQTEQVTTLAKIIQDLSEEERELLRLRFLAQLSYPEMARLLQRSEDAVKKSTYRLLVRLHNQLEDSNE